MNIPLKIKVGSLKRIISIPSKDMNGYSYDHNKNLKLIMDDQTDKNIYIGPGKYDVKIKEKPKSIIEWSKSFNIKEIKHKKMKETNLIEEDPGSEPIMNNAPVIVNEVDINSLIYTSKQTLDRETSLECRMNKLITYGVKEISYKCPNCPDNMKHLCLYCLETCHKSHINNLPSYLFKSDMIDFQKHPCECAKFHHKTKIIQKVEEKDNENKMKS